MENRQKPLHVFIIPDGNRRWAKEKDLRLGDGHAKGYEVFKSLIKEIWGLGVTHLTAWGLSKDNLEKRSKEEIKILAAIFRKTINELLISDEVEKEKLHIRIIGRWKNFFDANLIEDIEKLEKKTALYQGGDKTLTLLLAYNGDDELEEAIAQFHLREPKEKIVRINSIRWLLWTWFLPDVNIYIRTGYEPHLSKGALMMQMQNAHLYFPQMYWPDFTIEELAKIIDDFKNRGRRFGA